MKCPKCGKEISDESEYCPYCGARAEPAVGSEYHYHNREEEEIRRNQFGMWGFVFSIVALFISMYLVVPALGIVLSAIGVAKKNKYDQWNKLATAGLIISIILFVFYLVYYILEGFGFAIYF
ncbi:MAG: zinc-ribbon domain-containing protein [Coprobacillus sp.]|nr:zinc-ribbon domain-containing protein [Coprobacillus sp.]